MQNNRKTRRLSVGVAGWENLYLHYAYNLASELCLYYKLRLYLRSMLLELNLQNLSLSDGCLKSYDYQLYRSNFTSSVYFADG